MDKCYADKKAGVIKYESGLNTVEIDIDRQEVKQLPSEWIVEKVKSLIIKLLPKEEK